MNTIINYILDGKTPVPEPDTTKWGKWIKTANRQVAEDFIGDIRISTVFLGMDHNFFDDVPILFETMVFGGPLDSEQERYYTWAEAEQGHKEMVKRVKESL